jgi:hypothetical protein
MSFNANIKFLTQFLLTQWVQDEATEALQEWQRILLDHAKILLGEDLNAWHWRCHVHADSATSDHRAHTIRQQRLRGQTGAAAAAAAAAQVTQ